MDACTYNGIDVPEWKCRQPLEQRERPPRRLQRSASTGDWADPELLRRDRTQRLFEGPLSERSRHQALGILSGLLPYLVSAGYLAGNPLALRRGRITSAKRSRRSSATSITRCGTTYSRASSSGRT